MKRATVFLEAREAQLRLGGQLIRREGAGSTFTVRLPLHPAGTPLAPGS